MKKLFACLFVLGFILVGCTNDDEGYDPFGSTAEERHNAETSSSSKSSTKENSSSEAEIEFYVRTPSYNNTEKTATILGKANDGDNVTVVTSDGVELGNTKANDDGFSIKIDLPDNDNTEITVSNGTDSKKFELLSKSSLDSSESRINKTYTGTETTASVESFASTSQSTSSVTPEESSPNKDDQKEITSPSSEQKDLLISWTQLDCEDRNVKLKYEGKDRWHIATNYIDGVNNWIVTTKDRNNGRIKAVYQWDGSKNSGAKLVYLLVSGEELLNIM